MDRKDSSKPSSPTQGRYYPSSRVSEPSSGYPPIPPSLSAPPASAPGGWIDDGQVNGQGDSTGNATPGGAAPYPPYTSASSLPLRQKPGTMPPPQQLPQSLPPQQLGQPYPSQMPPPPPSSYAPSMVELPPKPTASTSGSVVSAPMGGPPPPGGYVTGRPPPGPPALTQSPGPMYATDTATKADLRTARTNLEVGLGRLLDLQRQHRQHLQYGPGAASVPNSTAAAVQDQLRLQTGSVLHDLRYVRRALSAKVKAAESHRFRRWLIGGVFASFIPLVRRLFRRSGRGADGAGGSRIQASNDTEYAFVRSRSLVDRMLSSVHRRGGLASIAFFVFAVLYIFSNEVSLRVARTVGRRLKKLSAKIERGDEELNEADLKQLAGWRWRVLLWGRK